MFVDAAEHDYRLRPESPALKLGFKQIPMEKIGPFEDEMRASWPIVEAPGVSARGDFVTVRYAEIPEYVPVPAREFAARDGAGNFFAKLAAKNPLKVAYFGGGIHPAGGWRAQVLKWLRGRYQGVEISEIDGSICDCVRGSGFSVYRFAHDVLKKKPDLVLVDFASDDYQTDPAAIWGAIEGVVRQAWKADRNLDIIFLYAFRGGSEEEYGKGVSPTAVSAYERVAEHYGIPSINMGYRIADMARAGRLVIKASVEEAKNLKGKVAFSQDGARPSGAGDQIYAGVITEALGKLCDSSGPRADELKRPFKKDSLERAKQVPITEKMLSGKWVKLAGDDPLSKRFDKEFDTIWITNTPGSKLTFRFKGTDASIFDLMGPDTGQVKVTVDGKDLGAKRQVDPWAYYQRLAAVGIAEKLEDKEHTVTVELLPDAPDRRVPMEEARKKNMLKPEEFKGVALRFGWIRLVGEIEQ
jgi:hypothetical protein